MHSFACISDLLTSDWCKQENPSLFNNWNNDVRMQALFARIPYTSYPTSRTSHDPYHRLHSTPSSSSSLSQTITTKFDFWADLLVWVMRTEPRLLTAGDGGSEGRGGDGRKPPASYSRLAISITSSSQFASKFKRKALVPLGLNSVLVKQKNPV